MDSFACVVQARCEADAAEEERLKRERRRADEEEQFVRDGDAEDCDIPLVVEED